MKTKSEIKKLLQEHNEFKIPVNIVNLAKKMGFSIIQQDIDYDGAILIDNEKKFKVDGKEYNKLIIINNNQYYYRKIFTIAHEIGHYINEVKDNNEKIFAHREESNKFEKDEINANRIASELLMPTELLDNFIKDIKQHYTDYYLIVNAIAQSFNVSHAAAEYRYDQYLRGE